MVTGRKTPRRRLSRFIATNMDAIVEQWEQFAKTLPSGQRREPAVLRDHALGILRTIVADLNTPQTSSEQVEKSRGRPARKNGQSNAERHGAGRLAIGFTLEEVIAEFRALRASVLHLWEIANSNAANGTVDDITRFNEAVDQALAESIERFALEKAEYTRRFDTLLSSSPDFHCIFSLDGSISYANAAFCSHLGRPREDIVGTHLQTLCPKLARRIPPMSSRSAWRGKPCATNSGWPSRAVRRSPTGMS
jgi:PAS domain-containing protein